MEGRKEGRKEGRRLVVPEEEGRYLVVLRPAAHCELWISLMTALSWSKCLEVGVEDLDCC